MEENIGVYEGLFILDANAYARDHDGLEREVNGLIEAAEGHIEVSRLWEERRLAYPIKGHRKGAYWITYFRMPTSKLTGLTHECEIHDNILRQLFIRLPGSLVEPILEHVRSGGVVRAVPISDDSINSEDSEDAEELVEEVGV